MISRATARFWECYRNLPKEVRELARKNYQLWRQDIGHPSLFKPIGNGQWSVRVGLHIVPWAASLETTFLFGPGLVTMPNTIG